MCWHFQSCSFDLKLTTQAHTHCNPCLLECYATESPHSWGSLSRETGDFGDLISSLQNLEVSSWSLVRSGHHCPHDSFKFRELGCPTLHTKGEPGVFGSGSRDWAVPIPPHQRSTPASSTAPLSSRLSGPRCPNQAWQGFTTGAKSWLKKPEPETKNLALPLGLACWEKLTLSFKSPPIMKTGLKIMSPSWACHLS